MCVCNRGQKQGWIPGIRIIGSPELPVVGLGTKFWSSGRAGSTFNS